jgi:hypothetical protein
MNVKHLDHVIGDTIEEPVRIADERNHANAGTLRNLLRALWPPSDTLLDGAKPFLERHGYSGICKVMDSRISSRSCNASSV